MKQYQKEVNHLIQQLASDIVEGKLSSKRAINKALAKLAKDIQMPMEELKVRLAAEADKTATKAAHAAAKKLMALNQDATVKSMTAKEISKLIEQLFTSELVFSKMQKDGTIVKYAIDVDDWFDYLGEDMVKKVRQGILAGYISGDHPAEVASNVLLNAGYKNTGNKALKSKVYILSETLMHKSQQLANLNTFIKNERYIKWIKYQTAEDDRVDTVCKECQKESIAKKYPPSEYPIDCVPSLHPNCRCALSPMTK